MPKYTKTAIGRLIPMLYKMGLEYTVGFPVEEFRALWEEAMQELERVGPVLELMRLHDETWKTEITEYWYNRLVSEVGELGAALVGAHDDSPVWEMMQVATIALNFLRRRGHDDAEMMRQLRFRWYLYGPDGTPGQVEEGAPPTGYLDVGERRPVAKSGVATSILDGEQDLVPPVPPSGKWRVIADIQGSQVVIDSQADRTLPLVTEAAFRRLIGAMCRAGLHFGWTPAPAWCPTSSGLPEEDQRVLVYISRRRDNQVTEAIYQLGDFLTGCFTYKHKDVDAWMPLPVPPDEWGAE